MHFPFNFVFISVLLCAVASATPNSDSRMSSLYLNKIFPRVFDALITDALETPIQVRAIMYLNLALWNAWAPYHPTAVDVFGRSRFRRPIAEHTLRNKNVAIMFSQFRLYQAAPNSFGGPTGIQNFRKVIEEEGYNPDDMSEDLNSPVGIGNRVGRDTAQLLALDGWNAEGELTSSIPNYRQPYRDHTGYTPVNSPWELKFPLRWQPLLESDGTGFFFRQEFVVPQAASAMAYSLSRADIAARKLPLPYARINASAEDMSHADKRDLRALAMDVLRRSAVLTERQRVLAEYFDNKALSFITPPNPSGTLGVAAAVRFEMLPIPLDWSFDDDVIYGIGANIVSYEAVVVAWKEKRRIDAVRPTSQTMEYLFGGQRFEVWRGPGKGTVSLPAREWQPYIRTMPHSEFPSASACLCSSLIEHAQEYAGGRDDFSFSFTVPKGASKFYPGVEPSRNVTVSVSSLSEFAELCGQSRLWAGVHFAPAVTAGQKLCQGLGKVANTMVEHMLAGRPSRKWMDWIPRGTPKFWEA